MFLFVKAFANNEVYPIPDHFPKLEEEEWKILAASNTEIDFKNFFLDLTKALDIDAAGLRNVEFSAKKVTKDLEFFNSARTAAEKTYGVYKENCQSAGILSSLSSWVVYNAETAYQSLIYSIDSKIQEWEKVGSRKLDVEGAHTFNQKDKNFLLLHFREFFNKAENRDRDNWVSRFYGLFGGKEKNLVKENNQFAASDRPHIKESLFTSAREEVERKFQLKQVLDNFVKERGFDVIIVPPCSLLSINQRSAILQDTYHELDAKTVIYREVEKVAGRELVWEGNKPTVISKGETQWIPDEEVENIILQLTQLICSCKIADINFYFTQVNGKIKVVIRDFLKESNGSVALAICGNGSQKLGLLRTFPQFATFIFKKSVEIVPDQMKEIQELSNRVAAKIKAINERNHSIKKYHRDNQITRQSQGIPNSDKYTKLQSNEEYRDFSQEFAKLTSRYSELEGILIEYTSKSNFVRLHLEQKIYKDHLEVVEGELEEYKTQIKEAPHDRRLQSEREKKNNERFELKWKINDLEKQIEELNQSIESAFLREFIDLCQDNQAQIQNKLSVLEDRLDEYKLEYTMLPPKILDFEAFLRLEDKTREAINRHFHLKPKIFNNLVYDRELILGPAFIEEFVEAEAAQKCALAEENAQRAVADAEAQEEQVEEAPKMELAKFRMRLPLQEKWQDSLHEILKKFQEQGIIHSVLTAEDALEYDIDRRRELLEGSLVVQL